MPLATLPGEDDIMARLRNSLPNVHVARGEYLEDSYEPKVDENGMFSPYVLVAFGGNFEFTREGSIVGARWDTQVATFTIYVVTPSPRECSRIRDIIREKLSVDFRPTDGGPVTVNTGYSFTDSDLGYHRYVQAIGFRYLFNLS